jgi:hypothetical protein
MHSLSNELITFSFPNQLILLKLDVLAIVEEQNLLSFYSLVEREYSDSEHFIRI